MTVHVDAAWHDDHAAVEVVRRQQGGDDAPVLMQMSPTSPATAFAGSYTDRRQCGAGSCA
jgi:hypothetical protein